MARCCGFRNGRLFSVRSVFSIVMLLVLIVTTTIIFQRWTLLSPTTVSQQLVNRHNDRELPEHRLDTGGNSSTCVFPDVNMYEPSVMKIAGIYKETMQCGNTYLPDLTYVEGTRIIVNASKVDAYVGQSKFLHCKYRHIWRNETDDDNFVYSDWSESFKDEIQLPQNAEFLRVQCWNNDSVLVSNTYLFLVPRKEQFDEFDTVNFRKREVESAPKETLNIVMIIFDSLQRYQFIRGCNKTYSYLMNTLKSFDLSMHSQLGRNTFPNFLPLFTGHLVKETMKWWDRNLHMDTIDMLWSTFEKAGYCTMYTENSPYWGAFHWLHKGFKRAFARFYTRPMDFAIEDDRDLWKWSKFCAGNQLELNLRLDYIGRLLDTFPDKPVFAVAMMSKETHDNQSVAKIFDDHILHFYKLLNDKGHLNRTLLITLSDHGSRWGEFRESVNGYFESRTPFTILTFPEWFLKKYPDVAKNLRTNTKRLTSHFDTHATLLDLLYFKSDSPPPLPPSRHGLSLLKEIPWNRSCLAASIPLEFCLCGYKEAADVNLDSELSINLSQVFIKELNQMNPRVCAPYTLKQTMRVTKITFAGDDVKENQGNDLYKVKLQAVPGDAIFESYIYVEQNSTVFKLAEYVFRLNAYNGQSDCVSHPEDRPMCYCKNLLTPS